jgi:alpha-glucosidase
MLSLYRAAIAVRRESHDLRSESLAWLDLGEQAIAFRRGEATLVVANLGGTPLALPPHRELILGSAPLAGGALPPDSTAWLAV